MGHGHEAPKSTRYVDATDPDIIDESQKVALEEFKQVVAEWPGLTERQKNFIDDAAIFRYLRARQYNVKKATDMFRATLDWREEFKPDEVTIQKVHDQAVAGSNYTRGRDSLGHPTVYMRVHRDPPGNAEEKLNMIVYVLERAIRSMDASKGVEKLIYIIDLSAFSMSWSSRDLKVGREWLKILQNHYPERCYRILLIDAPTVFWLFWRMLTPFVDPITKNKVVFLHGQKKIDYFAEHFNIEELEEDYGGGMPSDYNATMDK
eukprot:Opistho-2@71613